ncbi:unnamed protein product [Gongylonema pulchrum]|uniref:Uncharacterized protein n=1 Tax=Gongylonema pulchrum TaxID=637853 RepID=A0A183CV95_9BILA|nr:unnamed protein product [Gongylonema pulchrum]
MNNGYLHQSKLLTYSELRVKWMPTVLLLEVLPAHAQVERTCPAAVNEQRGKSITAERLQQQQQQAECTTASSVPHAFRFVVRQQPTTLRDVACQCGGNDSEHADDDNDGDSGDSEGDSGDEENDGLLASCGPSANLPFKISTACKRPVVTFRSPLSRMKLLNELETEAAPLLAGTFADTPLTTLISSSSPPSSSTSPPASTTTRAVANTVSRERSVGFSGLLQPKKHAYSIAPVVGEYAVVPSSCYDLIEPVVRVRRLALPRSASDSKMSTKTRRQPKLVFATTRARGSRCTATDELGRLTADIAAENPDMIHFQQVLNAWITKK